MMNGVEAAERQLSELKEKLGPDAEAEMAKMIDDAMIEAEEVSALLKRPPPAMSYRVKPRLREEIRSLMQAINNAVNAPTEPQAARLAQLREEKAEAQSAYEAFLEGSITDININARTNEIPQIQIARP